MECTITWWSLAPVIMVKGLNTFLLVKTIGICFPSERKSSEKYYGEVQKPETK